jgi:hypothetical protein
VSTRETRFSKHLVTEKVYPKSTIHGHGTHQSPRRHLVVVGTPSPLPTPAPLLSGTTTEHPAGMSTPGDESAGRWRQLFIPWRIGTVTTTLPCLRWPRRQQPPRLSSLHPAPAAAPSSFIGGVGVGARWSPELSQSAPYIYIYIYIYIILF